MENSTVGWAEDFLLEGAPKEFVDKAAQASVSYSAQLSARPQREDLTRDQELSSYNYGKRKDVPLDMSTGVPLTVRAGLSMQRSITDKIRYLQGLYGEQNVDLTPIGDIVLRNVKDETGKVKDMTIDPVGFEGGDIVDLMGSIPEMAGAALALIVAKNPIAAIKGKVAKAGAQILTGNIGAQGAGALNDIRQRALAGVPIDINEILKARGTAGAEGVILDSALGITAKVFRNMIPWLRAPFGADRPEVTKAVIEAQKHIKDKLGIEIPLTVGEETGIPILLRAESVTEKVGGGPAFRALRERRQEGIAKVQRALMDVDPTKLPSEAELGEDAVALLRKEVEGIEGSTSAESIAAREAATKKIATELGASPFGSRIVGASTIGKTVRGSVLAKFKAFQDESASLYSAVRSHPLARQPIIPTAKIKQVAKSIEDDLPKKRVAEGTGDIVDDYGNLVSPVDSSGRKILTEWVPAQTRARLREIPNFDEEMPLTELLRMRSDIDEQIQFGNMLEGLSTGDLKRIRGAITEAIDTGLKKASPELRDAWVAANSHYRAGMERFDQAGVRELLRDASAPGYVFNSQIVKRVIGGEGSFERWQQLKDLLGESDPAVAMLRRGAIDDLVQDSVIGNIPGATIVDAKTLLGKLTGMDRELQAEFFGKNAPEVIRMLQELGWFQGKIDLTDFENIIRGSTGGPFRPSALPELQAALDMQRKLNARYAAGIYKKFVKGVPTPDDVGRLDPGEFVSRYLDEAASPNEVAMVMSHIAAENPDLARQIRAKTIEGILLKSQKISAETIIRTGKGPVRDRLRIDGDKLTTELFGTDSRRRKLEVVIGSDAIKMLDAVKDIAAVERIKDEVGATAGGLAATSTMGRVTQWPKIAAYRGISEILASDFFRKIALSQAPRKDIDSILTAIIIGGPLLSDASKEFADDAGFFRFLNYFASSLTGDEEGRKQPELPPPTVDEQLLMEYLRKPQSQQSPGSANPQTVPQP